MIPRTCINCEHCLFGLDGETITVAWCAEPPSWVHIVEPRAHHCSRFSMAGQPRFVVPEEEGAEDVHVEEG